MNFFKKKTKPRVNEQATTRWTLIVRGEKGDWCISGEFVDEAVERAFYRKDKYAKEAIGHQLLNAFDKCLKWKE